MEAASLRVLVGGGLDSTVKSGGLIYLHCNLGQEAYPLSSLQ
jgi:hypothetical protein